MEINVQADWEIDPEWGGGSYGEKANVWPFELVAYEIQASGEYDRKIGWEVFSGPMLHSLVAKGEAASFEAAQRAAEAVWEKLQLPLPRDLEWDDPEPGRIEGSTFWLATYWPEGFSLVVTTRPAEVEDGVLYPQVYRWEILPAMTSEAIYTGEENGLEQAQATAAAVLSLALNPV
ncbi:hypothetical protein [Novosphingobium terrae]|uniref:hypothetical protein n=1 Tax=Novosphingobium terrae TaxID=2726189 RepID=UPI001981079A|nr:hypothetical protein [Novosphingobium terrae]